MAKKTDFTNEAQQNLIKIVHFLATDVTRATTVQELVDALGGMMTKNQIYWTLQNLLIGGWVVQEADGWKLCPDGMNKIAQKVSRGVAETVKKYLGQEVMA